MQIVLRKKSQLSVVVEDLAVKPSIIHIQLWLLHNHWRAKRAHIGQVDGKLYIATHAHTWYIYICQYIHIYMSVYT